MQDETALQHIQIIIQLEWDLHAGMQEQDQAALPQSQGTQLPTPQATR